MTYEEMKELMESLVLALLKTNTSPVLEPFEPGENPIIGIEFEGWDLLLEVSLA